MSSYAERIIDSLARSCYDTEQERLKVLNDIIAELEQYREDLLEAMDEEEEEKKETNKLLKAIRNAQLRTYTVSETSLHYKDRP